MTEYLPPNLLALFAPREPIPFLPPPDKLPHEKKNRGYSGVGEFLASFEDPLDTPAPRKVETREERLDRRRREKEEQVAYKLEQEIAVWDPQNLPTATSDPFKTLFVARINYDSSESKLRREFEVYGPIKKIVVSHNVNDGKPRGYAFIEYEHERDMHTAYKHADGKKIDGRRVLVDVERARTVKGWLPRRLGGGLGGTRRGGPEVNLKHSGREDNERERERYRMERERDMRPAEWDRDRDRRRSRSRERGGGSERGERRRRSRSRSRERSERGERKRHRSRSREARERRPPAEDLEENGSTRGRDRKRSRRSRSKDRTERKKDKKRDRERDRESRKERRDRYAEPDEPRIKEEPIDDYPDYLDPTPDFADVDNYGSAAIKYERMLAMSEAAAAQRAASMAQTQEDYEDNQY
ncbi:U1 small nuclear ribonucleoprotein 70 kDa-like isoform X1 [Neocloeon triangulifer]|uniref:U1 small nuclear ribonucleoprotein 70 kDa-like isoform X1 n=1 Tax=Neocloeon triangulifer TaxID=2078957 RepID=UPI00286F61C3|nr:U1 small nuclear ribonucleoprotein 70 kDa-like isoform X1 [Neocloeon triangulifer]